MMKPEIYDRVSALHESLVDEIRQYLEKEKDQLVNVSVTLPIAGDLFVHKEVITCVRINSVGNVVVDYNDSFYGDGINDIELYSIDELVKIIEAL